MHGSASGSADERLFALDGLSTYMAPVFSRLHDLGSLLELGDQWPGLYPFSLLLERLTRCEFAKVLKRLLVNQYLPPSSLNEKQSMDVRDVSVIVLYCRN